MSAPVLPRNRSMLVDGRRPPPRVVRAMARALRRAVLPPRVQPRAPRAVRGRPHAVAARPAAQRARAPAADDGDGPPPSPADIALWMTELRALLACLLAVHPRHLLMVVRAVVCLVVALWRARAPPRRGAVPNPNP